MTTKKGNLAKAFNKTQEKAEPDTNKKNTEVNQRSRRNKKSLNAFVDPEVAKQLKLLSVETGITQQDLLIEALNELFIKHGKKPIA